MQTYSELLQMPYYLTVLAALHRLERPHTYLELGVNRGRSLQLSSRRTLSVGVDPNPQVPAEIEERYRIERTTSDAFFGSGKAQQFFGGTPIDMAFLDGMHLFEYVLRDFMNVEQYSDEHTLVVIHDLLPSDMGAAAREPISETWMGDVWKLLLVLDQHRPDLEVCLVNAPPSGLGLVRGLNADSKVIPQAYEALLTEYGGLTFADWEDRQRELVPRLLTSQESLAWRRRLIRQISRTRWRARARHPVQSTRGVERRLSGIVTRDGTE